MSEEKQPIWFLDDSYKYQLTIRNRNDKLIASVWPSFLGQTGAESVAKAITKLPDIVKMLDLTLTELCSAGGYEELENMLDKLLQDENIQYILNNEFNEEE